MQNPTLASLIAAARTHAEAQGWSGIDSLSDDQMGKIIGRSSTIEGAIKYVRQALRSVIAATPIVASGEVDGIYTLSANGLALGRRELNAAVVIALNASYAARHLPYKWSAL